MTTAPPPPQRVKHDHHHFNTSGNNSGLIWDRVRFGRGQRQESDNDKPHPRYKRESVGSFLTYKMTWYTNRWLMDVKKYYYVRTNYVS